ncbi:MAG TPA: hypothetical protein VFJ71_08520 [Candidatus Limnocylindrales bacterium]|nr:hypothetical protein [Candidatus Limnocylindrales bacterium]
MTPSASGLPGRRRRPPVAAALIVGLGTVLVAAISFALVGADRSTRGSPSPAPTSAAGRSDEPAPVSGPPESRAYLDAAVAGAPADPLGPTTLHPIALADGRWWAALLDPPTGQTRLYRLSADGAAFRDTGRIVDERPGAVADTLWAANHLYVASVVRDRAVGSGVRLSRYTADPSTGFRPDPDFPIQLTDRGVRSMALARDGSGRLWLAVVRDGALEVAHSTTNDANWTAATPIPGAGALDNDDVVALLAFGPDRMGLAWTARTENAVRFVWRADTDAGAAWSPVETISSNMPLLRDPISAVAGPDGSVLVSVAGDVRGSVASPAAARLTVARRDAGGTWTATVAGRVEDRHGSSAILATADTGEIDLVATQGSTGSAWVVKRSNPDRLEFEAGPGTPLAAPVGISSLDLGGPHVAAGPSTDEVVAVGFDATVGRYVHTVIRLATAGGPGTTPSASPAPSGTSPEPSGSGDGGRVAGLPLAVVNDTFDVFKPGVTAPNGWLPRSGDPASRIVVRTATGHGSVLTLRSTAADNVRACKTFGEVSTGTLSATVLVRLDGLGTSDATITSLRLHGSEAALVRFGSGGTFAYYAGAAKIRTAVAWKVGTWYRSTVRVNWARRTYDWDLSLPGGRTLVHVTGIRFRDPTATSVDSICVQTSAGRANLGLTVDRVVVTR